MDGWKRSEQFLLTASLLTYLSNCATSKVQRKKTMSAECSVEEETGEIKTISNTTGRYCGRIISGSEYILTA